MTVDPFHAELLAVIPQVRLFALRLVGSNAEDLLQDTVEKALRARGSFIPGSSMRAWLCTICRNTSITQRRKAWRTVALLDSDWMTLATAPSQIDHLVLQDLQVAYAGLSGLEQEVMAGTLDGVPHAVMAQRQGVPVGTIKSRVSRTRAKLSEAVL